MFNGRPCPRPQPTSSLLVLSLKLTGAELKHLPPRPGSRSRDGRPSGSETELHNGERKGTVGVERLEVGEPGVALGLVNVVEAAEVLADECTHVAAERLAVYRLGRERMGVAADVREAG